MDDQQIIQLFYRRSEDAIRECEAKYAAYCRKIAMGILGSPEESEECLNDTWLRAWNAIPPEQPERLSVYLGKITRNLAIDRYRKAHAKGREGFSAALCLDELSECVGSGDRFPEELVLKDLLEWFLVILPEKSRKIFLYRYFYFLSVREIADTCRTSESMVKMTLHRVRKKLKKYLEKENVIG